MLFHLQHTFEGSYKSRDPHYSHYVNCFLGCSLLVLPRWLKWFSLGIEYHHIHHLDPQVPCYCLERCHDSAPALWKDVKALHLREVLQTLPFSVYDECAGNYRSTLESSVLSPIFGSARSPSIADWHGTSARCECIPDRREEEHGVATPGPHRARSCVPEPERPPPLPQGDTPVPDSDDETCECMPDLQCIRPCVAFLGPSTARARVGGPLRMPHGDPGVFDADQEN